MSNYNQQFYFWNNVFKSVTTKSYEEVTGLEVYKLNNDNLKKTYNLVHLQNKSLFASNQKITKYFCTDSLDNLKVLKKYGKLGFDTFLTFSNIQCNPLKACNLKNTFDILPLNTLKKFNKAFNHFENFYILTCSNNTKVLVAKLLVTDDIYETLYCVIDILKNNEITEKDKKEKTKICTILKCKQFFNKHKFVIYISISLILFLIGIFTKNIIFIILDLILLGILPEY